MTLGWDYAPNVNESKFYINILKYLQTIFNNHKIITFPLLEIKTYRTLG